MAFFWDPIRKDAELGIMPAVHAGAFALAASSLDMQGYMNTTFTLIFLSFPWQTRLTIIHLSRTCQSKCWQARTKD